MLFRTAAKIQTKYRSLSLEEIADITDRRNIGWIPKQVQQTLNYRRRKFGAWKPDESRIAVHDPDMSSLKNQFRSK